MSAKQTTKKKKKTRGGDKKPSKPRFTDQEIESIPLIPWKYQEKETKVQQELFWVFFVLLFI